MNQIHFEIRDKSILEFEINIFCKLRKYILKFYTNTVCNLKQMYCAIPDKYMFTLSLPHFYFHTFTLLLSHSHFHTFTSTVSLLHFHCHTFNFTLLLSPGVEPDPCSLYFLARTTFVLVILARGQNSFYSLPEPLAEAKNPGQDAILGHFV